MCCGGFGLLVLIATIVKCEKRNRVKLNWFTQVFLLVHCGVDRLFGTASVELLPVAQLCQSEIASRFMSSAVEWCRGALANWWGASVVV